MRLPWMPVFLLFSATLLAQSLPVQPCTSDALDAIFQGKNGPDHHYTLALNLRNISTEGCFVATYPGAIWVLPDPAPDGTRVRQAGSRKPTDRRINLEP